jgi:WD40 repeat protein/serine/threonine protein kinase
MTVERQATLLERLREAELLEPAQLEELAKLPEASDPDPRALGRVLLQRKLLTRFQINQAALGKGKELRVGKFLLLDKLGEGGMGQVYRARDTRMGRLVALKLMRKEKLAKPESVKRFYQEIQAASQLNHPNIVIAYDADQVGNLHYFSMELVDGIDLARQIKDNGPLPIALACEYVRQAAVGLQHAHEKGLVHRDIKPANLLVANNSGTAQVKILDMGLARLQGQGETGLTQAGQVLGTPDYLAPEQAYDSRKADVRSDIYSLGCTLYYLLCGQPPFSGDSLAQVLLKHQMEEVIALPKRRAEVSPALWAVVRKMMAKAPDDRYQSAAEMVEALAPFARGETGPRFPVAPVAPIAPPDDTGGEWATLAGDEVQEVLRRSSPSKSRGTTQIIEAEQPSRRTRRRREKQSNRTLLFVLLGAAAAVPVVGAAVLAAVLFTRPRALPETDAGKEQPVAVKTEPVKPAESRPAPGKVDDDKSKRVQGAPASPHHVLEGHTGPALRLAVSPDGQHAASASADRTIRLWNLKTAKSAHVFTRLTEIPVSLAFSTNGKRLLASTRTTLHEWDVETRRPAGRADRPGGFLTPNGRLYLVAEKVNNQFFLRVLDTTTGQERGRCQVSDQHAVGTGFSHEGTKAVVADTSDALHLIDLEQVRILRRFRSTAGTMRATVLFGDSILIGLADGTVRQVHTGPEGTNRVFRGRHAGTVWSVAVSADGRRALSAGEDWVVRLWDVEKGVQTGIFEGHQGTVRSVVFCPGDRQALSCGVDRTVRLWDLSRPTTTPPPGEPVVPAASPPPAATLPENLPGLVYRVEGHARTMWDVAAAPNGEQILSNDGVHIRVVDLKTRKVIRSFKPHEGGPFTRAAVAKDWRWIVTGGEDRMVRLWDLASGTMLKEFSGHKSPVLCVAISPDGRFALSAGGLADKADPKDKDTAIRLWDLKKGTQVHAFAGHLWSVLDVTFSADGKFALSCDGLGSWRRWDVRKRALVASSTNAKMRGVKGAFFRGDDHYLVALSDGGILLNGPPQYKGPPVLRGHKLIRAITISPDGRWALSSGGTLQSQGGKPIRDDCTVRVWDLGAGTEVGKFETPSPALSLALMADGRQVVTGGSDGVMRVWDLAKLGITPPSTDTIPKPSLLQGHEGVVNAVAFSPDGKYVLSGGADKTVRLWDPGTSKEVKRFAGLTEAIRSVGFSSDGKLLIASDASGRASVWEVGTAATISGWGTSSKTAAPASLIVPDGKSYVFAAGSMIHSGRLDGSEARTAEPEFRGKVYALACSADSRTLACGGSSGAVRLLSPDTLKQTAVLRLPHKGVVLALAFTPKGDQLLSAGADKVMLLHDLGTRKARRLTGHDDAVYAVAISPDGKWIVSGSKDATVRLWEIATGKEVKRYTGHKGAVRGVCFDPQGRRILSCGDTIRFWDLPDSVVIKPATP